MKGKVTCSCGHSWSKSDSSKKDMNVCHICGKDNTMKDGGWLDKYKDGGPVQENYNDYSVSAPEGYVGDGTFNEGRDYSPAWGGQFQMGGKVPVTKQDSLILYNNSKKVLDYYNNKNYKKSGDPLYYDFGKDYMIKNSISDRETFRLANNRSSIKVPLASGKSKNIKIPESMYYKKLDENKYFQRESANGILDTRAPMQLFDKRISPTMSSHYENTNSKDILYGDAVSISTYDPILIKPVSMLTPEERALRIKRYGEASGILNTKPNIKPKAKPKAPVPPIAKKLQPTPPSTIDWMEGNSYTQDFVPEVEQLQPVVTPNYGEVRDPRTGYTHMTRDGSPMYPLVGQPQMKDGGPVKRFMQPTETFKNFGYNPKEKGLSTEYSTSIGGPGEVYLVPGYRQGRLLNDPEATFNMYGEHLGGPFKTVQAAEDFAQLRHKYVEQNKNLPAPFKTRDYAMGGSIPGAVGFTYARTQSPAPSNGKYAKKTMASAQNGMEMRYYQNGLDFEPKGMGKNGKVIKDDRGQWAYPGEITEIGSNQITMQGVPYPVLGISDTGDTQMMYPNKEYEYDGESVTEYPMMKEGGALQLIKLDQLTNFTNYNTKQPGGWLDKYQ